MKKPHIAIFCEGNLPTNTERKIINNLSMYSCTILNTQTFSTTDNIIVDAVIGKVPERYKHLPAPDGIIEQYTKYLDSLGDNVGGNPPAVESEKDKTKTETETDKSKSKTKAETTKTVVPDGFGTAPTPPQE